MKTTGNKSVEVFKSADINTDEPTCLISINGDVNTLESIVLRKRQHYNKRKTEKRRPRRRRDVNIKNVASEYTANNSTEHIDKDLAAVELDMKHPVPESSEITPQTESDFKTEIKEELNAGMEEKTIPFVNVHIKVEPGDLTFIDQDCENGESSDHSKFDFATFDSDSDDDKPLIQRTELKPHSNSLFGHNSMDKFKHIIESAFPVVLVERLQYSEIKSAETKIKTEQNDDIAANKRIDKPQRNVKKIKAKKEKSIFNTEEQTSLYKCTYCTKELKTWASLIMHEQIHRNTFDCSACKLKCSTILELIKHSKENPNCSRRKESPLTCSICDNGVNYRNRAALNYHVTKHTGQRPFECDVCKKTVRILNSFFF